MRKPLFILLFLRFLPLTLSAVSLFETLEGKSISYEEIVSSPKAVVFAWATWCQYCRVEIEKLSKECTSYDGVEIFFVAVGQKKSLVIKYANDKKLKSCVRDKIVLDQTSYFVENFGILGIPTYLFFENGEYLSKAYSFSEKVVKEAFGDD